MLRFDVVLIIAMIFIYSLNGDQVRKCLSDTDCTNGEKCVQKNKICSTIVEIQRCEKERK
uniref:EB domain-containing protein n=1 Tax=Ascaris lumbricoides TaxID=6252 RepID=A0A0M3INC0_ASCLU